MTKDEWGKLNIDMIIDTNVVLCNGHERCNLIVHVTCWALEASVQVLANLG